MPGAIEQSLALNLDGLKGWVADSKAYTQRTLGLCLETGMGVVTLVPRTCSIRQEVETWGQHQVSLPLLLERPANRHGDAPRCKVEYQDGTIALAPIRFVTVSSTQLAQQHEQAPEQAQSREAEVLATHVAHLRATVGRHRSLAKGYATTAVRLIDTLLVRQAEREREQERGDKR